MTASAHESSACPTCGRAIPGGAPVLGGRPACPHCLLGAGIPTNAGAAADAPNAADVQSRFPDYEILGLLGRGGMGVVWKARNKALDRVVALKVLPAAAAAQPGFSDRFQREARALARLEHANIVGVHEFGVREGNFFLVMEYVDGVDMRHALRAGRIGPRDVLRIVPQICDALQYAHDHGVVHRDIKPENVMIDVAGRVKVADFGLAKIIAGEASPQELTLTGQVMGTPHYMAPEQFEKPTTVDHRADIYSLGVVFYEMLTGELPLGRFPPPSEKYQVDVRFDEVVLRSLHKQPELRWQHASEVKSEVGVIASTPRPALPPRPVPPPRAAYPGTGRLSRLAVAGAFGCAAAGALVLLISLAAASAGKSVSFPVLAVVFAIVAAAGWTLSVAAWVAIQRSRGTLRGLAWAITGTVMPLLVLCVGGPVVYVMLQRSRSSYAIRFIDGGAPEEVPAPAPLAGSDPRPRGARALLEKTAAASYSAALVLPASVDDVITRYAPDDSYELTRIPAAVRLDRAARGELGLPMLLRSWTPDVARSFMFVRVDEIPGGEAHCVVSNGTVVLTAPMRRVGHALAFAVGHVGAGGPEPGDPEHVAHPTGPVPPRFARLAVQTIFDAVSALGDRTDPAVVARFYPPAVRGELAAMVDERSELRDGVQGALGLPLAPDRFLGARLERFAIESVSVDASGLRGTVLATLATRRLRIPVVATDATHWYFDVAPVTVEGAPPPR